MKIDLRSDTVTKPSVEMLEAMMKAEVGDDVFNEDPETNNLERFAAELFKKEAALFCSSGTMANQIAIRVHTQPGDEVICDSNSHIFNYETGGLAANSGVQARLLKGNAGKLNVDLIASAVNGDYDWMAKTGLVSLENTVNKAGGTYYSLKEIIPISNFCRDRQIPLHLDGARIFNALIELNELPSDHAAHFNSLSVCLSKGLGAPVGSLLLGDKLFIKKARRIRKQFGGGMRQIGYLAAAGKYALQNNIPRLKEDHARARIIANALEQFSWVKEINEVLTNIIIFHTENFEINTAVIEKMQKKNIYVSAFGPSTIRMVTHLDFTDSQLELLLQALKTI